MPLALFSAVVLMVLMGVLLLGQRKAKPSSVNSLFDDEEQREAIKEEAELSAGLVKGRIVPFVREHNTIFVVLYKLFLIDVEKNDLMLLRANNKSRTGEELAAIQMTFTLCAILSLFFFLGITNNPVLSILTGLLFFMARLYPTIKYTSDHKRLKRAFSRDLPDYLNAIQIPIENGASPDDIFKKVSLEWDGVLGQEFQEVIRESANHGNMLYKPLEELAFKINYRPFSNFVHSFNTSLKTGVNMSLFIEKLCDEIRFQSHNDILESNRKKSTYITLVTAVFIMLPIVVMIMVPYVVNAIQSIK